MPEPASDFAARVTDNFEYWNGGEPELMVHEYAEDCELDLTAVFTDMAVFQGHQGLRDQIDQFWQTWEGLRMESLDVLDLGQGRFVVDVRLWGRGKRSGAEVDQRFAFLYTTRASDGKIIRAQLFPTQHAAIDFAAGAAQPG